MFRKPLVILTPKSLLRNRDATSPLSEFTKGEFRTVIGPNHPDIDPQKVKRVIACSGKVVYDLVKRRDEKKAWDVAILRVEQLYPFPHKAFTAELKKFPHATEVVWCQDEPQNQGAWFFVQHYIHENMLDGQKLGYAGRPALLDQAFGKLKGFVLSK
jgi:2-oxoglutarate dehydrogenase E1 component